MATGRIGVTPTLRTRWSKAPSAGTTSLSGLDDNSVSLVYDVGYEAVYRNGVLLSRTNDYTATTGNSITLIDATIAGDIIEVFANQLLPLTNAIGNGQYTAKGALLSATAASTPAVLTVGSNDQVLTADSSTATGLKWATPSSGGMTLLSTTNLSGSYTVSITGISNAYKDLHILIQNPYQASANGDLWVYFSQGMYLQRMLNTTVSRTTAIRGDQLLGTTSQAANSVYCIIIKDYANTTYGKPILFWGNTTSNNATQVGGGIIRDTSAISSITIEDPSGLNTNFSGGQVQIYGVK